MRDGSVALVFPGQGSQRAGMLADVPENDAFERLVDGAEALTGRPLRRLAQAGSDADLSDTVLAQPLLYLADWAWGVALLESGIEPAAVAGHSLGELAALAIAGAFSVEAGLELVVERARLMAAAASATPGGMAAVLGMSGDAVADAVAAVDGVWIANDNSPTQVVISGTHEGLDAATAALTDAGAGRVVSLRVAGPFHSPLMEPARAGFADILDSAEFRDSTIPVLQNVDPTPETASPVLKTRLAAQMTAPVRWTATVERLVEDGARILVEAGPGSVLAGLVRGHETATALSADQIGIERVVEEVS